MQPFEVGFDIASSANMQQLDAALGLTVTCNLLGLPAAVVPVGVAHGLPQAVQIIGARYQEMACLDAAEVIEASLGTVTPSTQSRLIKRKLPDLRSLNTLQVSFFL